MSQTVNIKFIEDVYYWSIRNHKQYDGLVDLCLECRGRLGDDHKKIDQFALTKDTEGLSEFIKKLDNR